MKVFGLARILEEWRNNRIINKTVALRRKGWTYKAIGERVGIPKDRALEICFRQMGSLETKKFNYKKGEKK
jgi:hypothetical protein